MEIWKEIKGYEGRYQVSSYGRVKSFIGKEKIIREQGNNAGYCQVTLCDGHDKKMFLVHRLVAETFIPNPDNLPWVNHKDEIPHHNFVENLEWCTAKYNIGYGTAPERRKETIRKKEVIKKSVKGNYHTRKVEQYDMKGKFIKCYDSVMDVERHTNICHPSIINCCKGKLKTAGGFVFKYKEDLE